MLMPEGMAIMTTPSEMVHAEGKMKLAPEIEDALDRFALEQEITREEALAVIARDWLIEQGYLRADEGDENERSAQD